MTDIGFTEGDIMIYKTNGSHFLTAVLEFYKEFDTHSEAAVWLQANGYDLPSNNITAGPLALEQSHIREYQNKVGKTASGDKAILKRWNDEYVKRGSNPRSSYFILTKPIYNAINEDLKEDDFLSLADTLRRHHRTIPNTAWRPQEVAIDCYEEIQWLIR